MPGDASRRIWTYLDRFPGDAHVLVVTSPNVTTDYLTGQAPFDHDAYTPLAMLHNRYHRVRRACGRADRQQPRAHGPSGARAPGSITAAVATSVGNPNHIALARVTRHVGGDVKALKVRAFDSARNAIADVVAGGCDLAAISATSALPELADGSLRALAVTSPERSARRLRTRRRGWNTASTASSMRGAASTARADSTPRKSHSGIQCWPQRRRQTTWQDAIARHHWSALYRNSRELAAHLQREREEMRATLDELGLLP